MTPTPPAATGPLDLPALAATLRAGLLTAFGPDHEQIRQTLCLAEEAGEFVQAARRYLGLARTPGDLPPVAAELADVVLTAFVTAEAFGIDLPAAIDAKAAIVRTRGYRQPAAAPGAFTVSCPACPPWSRPAWTETAALSLAGGHDDTYHDGTVTAVLTPDPDPIGLADREVTR